MNTARKSDRAYLQLLKEKTAQLVEQCPEKAAIILSAWLNQGRSGDRGNSKPSERNHSAKKKSA